VSKEMTWHTEISSGALVGFTKNFAVHFEKETKIFPSGSLGLIVGFEGCSRVCAPKETKKYWKFRESQDFVAVRKMRKFRKVEVIVNGEKGGFFCRR
jgi:hypothetical protein